MRDGTPTEVVVTIGLYQQEKAGSGPQRAPERSR